LGWTMERFREVKKDNSWTRDFDGHAEIRMWPSTFRQEVGKKGGGNSVDKVGKGTAHAHSLDKVRPKKG